MFGLFGRKKRKEEAMNDLMISHLIGKFYEHHEMTPPQRTQGISRQTLNCVSITTRIVGEAIGRHLAGHEFSTPSKWTVLAFSASAVAVGISRATKGDFEKASMLSGLAVLAPYDIESNEAARANMVALKEFNSWCVDEEKFADIRTVAASAWSYLLELDEQHLEVVARFIKTFLVPEHDQSGP